MGSQRKTGAESVAWNLNPFGFQGPYDPAIDEHLLASEKTKKEFERRFRGTLNDPKCLKEALFALKDIFTNDARIVAHLELEASVALRDARLQERMREIKNKLQTEIEYELSLFQNEHTSFFLEEICALDDALFENLIMDSRFAEFVPYLKNLRRFRGHTAFFKPEKRIALSGEFDERHARARYEDPLGGEPISIQRVTSLLSHPSREVRKKAFFSRFKGLRESGIEEFAAYSLGEIVKEFADEARTRGFGEPIALRNAMNNVSGEAVRALHDSVLGRGSELGKRYLRLKARDLGFAGDFCYFDRNAEIRFEGEGRFFTFNEARELILDCVSSFNKEIAEYLRWLFENERIHAPESPDKYSGAFCHGTIPGISSYILLNFGGKGRDVGTLAHELGHGAHNLLSRTRNSIFTYQPHIALAECASIFLETLVLMTQISRASSLEERYMLRDEFLAGFVVTVIRQTQFLLFEQALDPIALNARKDSAATATAFNECYLETLRSLYGLEGDVFVSYEGAENEWSYIPHFQHSRFYVYAYAYSALLVSSLYALYEENPTDEFVEKYLNLLRSGGSRKDVELMNTFGLDMTSPSFWDKGFDFIERTLKEHEKDSAELNRMGLLPLKS